MLKTCYKTYSRPANSLYIDHKGSNRFMQVTEAVLMANALLANKDFYYRIAAHPGFEMADVSPDIIAGLMCETSLKMTLNMYYAANSQLNIDGYDDKNTPSTIHLNIWKINRSAASICNSIIHACVHAVNAYNPYYTFGHGEKNSIFRAETAPYWIGALAQTMVSDGDPIILPMEHDPSEPTRNIILPNSMEIVSEFAQSMWLS